MKIRKRDNLKLVTIRRFFGSTEANLWKERLAAAGIKAVVVNDFCTGAAIPSNDLQVREKDVERAQKILKSLIVKHRVKPGRLNIWFVLFSI